MDIRSIKISQTTFISKKMETVLNQHDIFTVFDLLTFFPIKYENRSIVDFETSNNKIAIIKGRINTDIVKKKYRSNLSSLQFSISSNGQIIKVIIFNRDFLESKLELNKEVYIQGKCNALKKEIVATNVFFTINNEIEPLYSNINISQYHIKKLILKCLDYYGYEVGENLPKVLVDKYKLISLKEMIERAHKPKSNDDIKEVIRRNKYQEFFFFELLIKAYKSINRKTIKVPLDYDINFVKSFINNIPFELTIDQKNAVNEVFKDLKKNYPANRLIQGDVGSGKTIVAAISLCAAKSCNVQGALMAPTEILAIQHYHNLCNLFEKVDINIGLLTSSIKGKKRKELLLDLENGNIDILVGTHAIISEKINFKDLRIVITDEQHRFGVVQRSMLRKKGNNPDVFYLTATPIPRTLAISAFGDLDISSIKTRPIGRKEIITKVLKQNNYQFVFDFIEKELDKGYQAYIIAPLIEASEKLDGENVMDLYEKVKNHFKDKVLLIHGKMSPIDKENVMNRFKNNEASILVSTTVIEVGVDVKNATVMAIFNAERFGLSQIHQLRGRVGRGINQSYCFLLSDSQDVQRLNILSNVNDGFKLSEEDLKLRGPGDVLGTRQSGLPIFQYGDIVSDYKILEAAMNDALEIIENKLYMNEEYVEVLNYLINFEQIKKGIID